MATITCIIIYAVGFFCFYFSTDRDTIDSQIMDDIRQEQQVIEELKKN
jgi:hypothetical protein